MNVNPELYLGVVGCMVVLATILALFEYFHGLKPRSMPRAGSQRRRQQADEKKQIRPSRKVAA